MRRVTGMGRGAAPDLAAPPCRSPPQLAANPTSARSASSFDDIPKPKRLVFPEPRPTALRVFNHAAGRAGSFVDDRASVLLVSREKHDMRAGQIQRIARLHAREDIAGHGGRDRG